MNLHIYEPSYSVFNHFTEHFCSALDPTGYPHNKQVAGFIMPLLGETATKLLYDRKNPTIIRVLCLVCALVVYGCIAVEAWSYDTGKGRETCLYNDTGGACNFGLAVGFIGVVASIGFIMGEYIVDKTTMIKYRKEYFVTDCIFSAIWSLLYFLCFCILKNQWSKVEEEDLPETAGVGSVKTAIFFSFLSIFTWAICVYYAYIRLQAIKAEQEYAAEGGLAGGIAKFPDSNAAAMLGVTPTSPSVPIPCPTSSTGLQTFNVGNVAY